MTGVITANSSRWAHSTQFQLLKAEHGGVLPGFAIVIAEPAPSPKESRCGVIHESDGSSCH